MKVKKVKISQVIPNSNNPRIIKNIKFKKLVKSIEELPSMLELRPIVVGEDMVILGGNMRYKACIEAGLKEIPIIVADELTEDEKKAFVIKDNLSFGERDWDTLSNEWDSVELDDWGLDVWQNEDDMIKASLSETEETEPEVDRVVCALCGK